MNGNLDVDRLALAIGRLFINAEALAQQIDALKKENDELKANQNGD